MKIKPLILNLILMMVLLLPIVDLQFFVLSDRIVSIGEFVKSLYIVILFLYAMITCRKHCLKVHYFLLLILGLFSCIFLLVTVNNDLVYEMRGLINYLYLLVALICFHVIKHRHSNFISSNVIVYSVLGYSLVIIVSNIFQFDTNTFEHVSTLIGSKGLYLAANEVGAIIGLGIMIVVLQIKFDKQSIKKLLWLAVLLVASLILATKTPILCFILVFLYKTINVFITLCRSKNYKLLMLLTLFFILSIIIFIVVFINSSIYYNLNVHFDYLLSIDKYELTSKLDLIKKPYIVINEFVLSQRLELLSDINDYYLDSSLINKIFGIGYMPYTRSVEMDFFDLFYKTGIIGFLVYMIVFIYLLYMYNKDFKFSNEKKFVILVMLLIALLVGHVLFTISVAIILASYIASRENGGSKL